MTKARSGDSHSTFHYAPRQRRRHAAERGGPSRNPDRRAPWRGIRAAAACALLTLVATGAAQDRTAGPLLSGRLGGPLPPPRDIDPLLPTGDALRAAPRPAGYQPWGCSAVEPVCLFTENAAPNASQASARELEEQLDALAKAYTRLVRVVGLPAPRLGYGAGRPPALDLYLGFSGEGPGRALPEPRLEPEDSAPSFCVAARGHGSPRRIAALCVAEASLLGVNAASRPKVRRDIAEYLWTLWSGESLDLTGLDDLQARPERGLLSPQGAASSWPFFAHVDAQLGTAVGHLPVALLQLARGRTAPGALQWQNEPDALDVLRAAWGSERATSQQLLDFAVSRAFWGDRDTHREHPATRWAARAASPRFEWVIRRSSLPRRVAPRHPLDPYGSTYLWLELDRAPRSTLAFQAQWEPPATMRWAVLALSDDGALLRRFDLPPVLGSTSAERTVPETPGAAGLLIVGVSLGGVDRAHPYEVDHGPWEPHGYTVYLAELAPEQPPEPASGQPKP